MFGSKRIKGIYSRMIWTTSLQSMVDLDKILGAPTVPRLRWGCAKTVQKSSGAPLQKVRGCHCCIFSMQKDQML